MTAYTLHAPTGAQPGDPAALDRAELVKDGFSWGAFAFTFLWFWTQRLWLAGIVVLIGLAAVNGLAALLDLPPGAGVLASVAFSALVGFEANALKRWTYGRHGRPILDVVAADNREEAEIKAFTRWLGAAPARPAAPAIPADPMMAFRRNEPVIGLFPDAETGR